MPKDSSIGAKEDTRRRMEVGVGLIERMVEGREGGFTDELAARTEVIHSPGQGPRSAMDQMIHLAALQRCSPSCSFVVLFSDPLLHPRLPSKRVWPAAFSPLGRSHPSMWHAERMWTCPYDTLRIVLSPLRIQTRINKPDLPLV